MRRSFIVFVVLMVLGCGAYRLTRPDEPALAPAAIVVLTAPGVTAAQEDVIGPLLQHAPGVADIAYVTGVVTGELLWHEYPGHYWDVFAGPAADTYNLTVRDQAAYEALQTGSFRADVLATPGVADIFFGCRDIIECKLGPSDAAD